jgi:hypothetical protein
MLGALLALAIVLPAGASRGSTLQFKVVSAKATATLTFHTETADQSSISDGRVALSVSRKAAARGTLPGRVLFPLKGKLTERVTTKRRASDTSPYQEQTCSKTRKLGGRGGVSLRRIGSKVEVRWAFPQAKPRFCNGPSAGASITSQMRRLYPASRFSGKVVSIVLAGSRKIPSETGQLTYRWLATLRLARS